MKFPPPVATENATVHSQISLSCHMLAETPIFSLFVMEMTEKYKSNFIATGVVEMTFSLYKNNLETARKELKKNSH